MAPAREQCQGCSAGSVARNDYSLGVLWCLWKACLEGVARCAIIGACWRVRNQIKSNGEGRFSNLISWRTPNSFAPAVYICSCFLCSMFLQNISNFGTVGGMP